MSNPAWPVMTREQVSRTLADIERVTETLRVHLGREAPAYQLVELALRFAVEELERHFGERRPPF